jgi:hypothetical protein
MKSIHVMLLWMFLAAPPWAAGQTTGKFVYCEVICYEQTFNSEVAIEVDFGQKTKAFQSKWLKDASGQTIVFKSRIDALNYMGSLGWELVEVYSDSVGSRVEQHYLMKRPLSEEEEVKVPEY